MIVIAIGAGFYAYIQGDLDPALEFVFGPDAIEPQPTIIAAPPETPAVPVGPATEEIMLEPSVADTYSSADQMALITQLENTQSRVQSLERDTRTLLGIVEDLGAQVGRRNFEDGGGVSAQQLLPMQLEIVNLRLQLDGDTRAADAELEQLAAQAGPNTQLAQLIDANRLRLASMQPRTKLLALIDDFSNEARRAHATAAGKVEAHRSSGEQEGSLLGRIFAIQRESPTLTQALANHERLLDSGADLRTQLLVKDEASYLKTIDGIQQLLGAMRQQDPASVELVALAKFAGELAAEGYPRYRLRLEQ